MSHRAGRHRPRRQHPRCPSRGYFDDLDDARQAADRLGSVAASCRRCGGYHLELPQKAGRR
ncbi:hypothetical protein [Pseudonocardia sp. MH-G8]|uniref:hypothetical protein n=1 Tax=Pseudonocardia sp. MH-G8 TaxID=1854588 RepID=UPI000BA04753|nr:hypothetical protein [Pseudonocardia sp. MH-G8]OZM79920.1 hypothetical protein CFP66_23235 [Pseudonocardia sp. MH-G8]